MARKNAIRFEFERALVARGVQCIAGIDEAGRGPLAGPVMAAAVILPCEWFEAGIPKALRDLNDSKQLTAVEREQYFALLVADSRVRFAVAEISHELIDSINILQATHRAMNEALRLLGALPEHALVDGLEVRSLCVPQTAIVMGDSRSYSIAAASVLAKVTRDRRMTAYDREWPQYGFARHKGYATPEHLAALSEHGPCPIHRLSFSPVCQPELDLDLF